ncbi:MAG: AmmeMemoRadiSam system radical SAM enzyme [Lentisphaeria bacterium]|nr:AmmeMemoRadiSam system radical SAM enzyme [Lentisphaeria bacterium]
MQLAHTSATRRDFLCGVGLTAAGLAVGSVHGQPAPAPSPHEASFYEPLGNGELQCTLCPWQCVVKEGQRGKCGVRENRNGRYYTLVYGRPCAINNDPIEKKPFFHVYPRSKALSIATVGCNIRCSFCQNWEISQSAPEDVRVRFMKPEEIVKIAADRKSRAIAYTYSEPTIFYEYMVDCAAQAKSAGIGNVMVSNGFISKEPLKKLCNLMTAIKIDLKAFTQEFYGKVCQGRLRPVQETLKRISESGVWLEIVVLIIPTLNDGTEEIKRMAGWIVENLGADVPLHFTRFHPAYKLRNLPPTPVKTLRRVRQIAIEQGCHFVYSGNIPGMDSEDTTCPTCKALIIDRHGHSVLSNHLQDGKCPKCGAVIPGVWG